MPTGELFMTVLYARHNPPIWVDIEKSLQKYPFINYQIFMSFEDYKASPQ